MIRILASLLVLLLLPAAAQAARVEGVRVWPAPDHVRFVFDLDAAVEHSVFTLDTPHRVVIDLQNATLHADLSAIDLDRTGVRRIRSGRRGEEHLRLVMDLDQAARPRSFLLPPNPPYRDRLVVDLPRASEQAAASTPKVSASDRLNERRDIIVVIDPGHGGEDPGAIGPGKVREKDVVLSLSRKLKKRLDTMPGFRAHLVREGDYYVSLRNRTDIARKQQADLFVSVHADAFHSPRARGASVYTLSNRGATSETARWLAKRENQSDLVGGVGGVSLDDKDQVLAEVLLDLSMTASMSASADAGKEVLRSIGQVTRLHKHDVEKAGFVVLKSPDIPSMLVEAGFISNPGEARKLRSDSHQEKLAQALAEGILRYFERQPPPGTQIAWAREQQRERQYRIQRGDTLSGIAVQHGVTVQRLREANALPSDSIRVGQVLTIPAS